MNLSELRREVSRTLAEQDPAVFFEDDDIDQAINEGYEEISDASEWFERQANLQLLAKRNYYDLRSALKDDTFLAFKSAQNAVTNRWLDPVNLRDLDYRTFRQWETISGPPEKVFLRGLWWLGTFPRSSQDGDTAKVFYSAIPTPLVNDSDSPGFPRQFHMGLVEYANGTLLSQDGQSSKALIHFKSYLEFQKTLVDFTAGRIALDKVNVLHG